jgi:predicted DNA-binding transcriptional regulator YafY
MLTLKELERLQRLHSLIENECTGTPKQLAGRMQISMRSVHRLIEKLKDYHAEICFDRKRNTYYYCDSFVLDVSVTVRIITKNDTIKLYGGALKKSFPANFWQ